MKCLVWLARWVGHRDDQTPEGVRYNPPAGWYARPAELPIPPTEGLRLMVKEENTPETIEEVIVTSAGAVVCVLPREYCEGPHEMPAQDWPSYRDWLTDGWVYLGDGFPHYHLDKPEAVAA